MRSAQAYAADRSLPRGRRKEAPARCHSASSARAGRTVARNKFGARRERSIDGRLYSYVHGTRRRAKKSCRNVNAGTPLAFDPLTSDDDSRSTTTNNGNSRSAWARQVVRPVARESSRTSASLSRTLESTPHETPLPTLHP